MNKADLISAVAAEAGLSKVDAKKAVEAFVSTVTKALITFFKPRRSIYRSNGAFCLFVINQTILSVIILSTRMFYSASEDASSVETSSEDTSSEDTSEDASSETSSEDSSSISTKVTFSESFPNT